VVWIPKKNKKSYKCRVRNRVRNRARNRPRNRPGIGSENRSEIGPEIDPRSDPSRTPPGGPGGGGVPREAPPPLRQTKVTLFLAKWGSSPHFAVSGLPDPPRRGGGDHRDAGSSSATNLPVFGPVSGRLGVPPGGRFEGPETTDFRIHAESINRQERVPIDSDRIRWSINLDLSNLLPIYVFFEKKRKKTEKNDNFSKKSEKKHFFFEKKRKKHKKK